MFKMFKSVFEAIELFFNSLKTGAVALNHLAEVAEVNAKFFADEAKLENAARLNALGRELKLTK